MFKNYYLGKIQDKLENNFNSSVVQCSTTVEVDDVPTTINQYMFVEDGVVEYHETGEDDEDEIIIKDGVKYYYTGSKMYREPFNKDINNTFDLYKFMSGEDEGINFLTDDNMFTYVRKQLNGYYIEIDRATMNKFIANEVDSSFRITSKIKGDIDFKKNKLKTLKLEFEGKVNAAPFKVKVTLDFNIHPEKQEVSHPEDAYTLTWMYNNVVNLNNLNNETIQKLNIEGYEIKFSNNNVFITSDSSNFYIYDLNFNLTKTIAKVKTYYSSPKIIYVDNLLYHYESDYEFYVYNLNNNTRKSHTPKGTNYNTVITRIIPTTNPKEVYIFWTNNDIDLYNIETQTTISTLSGKFLYTENDDIYLYRTIDNTNLSSVYKLNNNILTLVYENIELNHDSYYSYYLYNNKLYLGNEVCERDFTDTQYIYNFNDTISFIENDLIFYTNGQILDLNDLYQPGIQTYSTNNIISLNNHYIIDTGDGFFKVEKSFITDYFN